MQCTAAAWREAISLKKIGNASNLTKGKMPLKFNDRRGFETDDDGGSCDCEADAITIMLSRRAERKCGNQQNFIKSRKIE